MCYSELSKKLEKEGNPMKWELVGAFILTVFAGYVGTVLLNAAIHWPDGGIIVAIAVMGCFILEKLQRS